MRQHSCLALVLLFGATACGDDKKPDKGESNAFLDGLDAGALDADDPEHVGLAASQSAPNVMFFAQLPLTLADVATDPEFDGDPSCPVRTESDDETTFEGGCTAADGRQWFGKATASLFHTTYDGFGFTEIVTCGDATTHETTGVYDGKLTFSLAQEFHVNMTFETSGVLDEETCDVGDFSAGYLYEGSIEGSDESEPQTWAGSGSFGTSEVGRLEIRTTNEVVDTEACETEALSGSTEVTAGSDVFTFTYDGATDCDETSTVTWTANGEARGELEGVPCAAAPGEIVAALVALTLVMRRRRSRG